MATNKNYFKVLNDSLNIVILIERFKEKELEEVFLSLRNNIQNLDRAIVVDEYYRLVVKHTVKNSSDLLGSDPNTTKSKEVAKSIYNSVLSIYPMLNINTVCLDVNAEAFFSSEMLEGLDEKIEEEIKKITSPQKQAQTQMNTKADIQKLSKYLHKNIIGQDAAVGAVIDCMKLVASKLAKSSSMFFIGPTGVGKTELARLLGVKYSGNFFKVNCAEYAGSHEYSKLIGSPPGYIGHTENSILAIKASKSNKWVFLFDEIEKASDKFFDFLLALLDTGYITDNTGKILDFSESIFIFTSNEGVSDIRVGENLGFSENKTTYSNSIDKVRESVTKKFSPEFINRIDSFVYFNSLTKQNARDIVAINLKTLPISKSEKLINYIVDNAFSEQYGARAIKRFIKTNLMVKLADKILDVGALPKGKTFSISLDKDNLTIILPKEEEAKV